MAEGVCRMIQGEGDGVIGMGVDLDILQIPPIAGPCAGKCC